jgi:DNA mismatch repair protein MutL
MGGTPNRVTGNDDTVREPLRTGVSFAVRFTDQEIAGLLADRDLVRDAHHCPHGRPTAVAFGRRDLEKLFKRV